MIATVLYMVRIACRTRSKLPLTTRSSPLSLFSLTLFHAARLLDC